MSSEGFESVRPLLLKVSMKCFPLSKEVQKGELSKAEASSRGTSFEEQCQQASDIIVPVLGVNALPVVRAKIRKPKLMMEKFDTRYDSMTVESRINEILELLSTQ